MTDIKTKEGISLESSNSELGEVYYDSIMHSYSLLNKYATEAGKEAHFCEYCGQGVKKSEKPELKKSKEYLKNQEKYEFSVFLDKLNFKKYVFDADHYQYLTINVVKRKIWGNIFDNNYLLATINTKYKKVKLYSKEAFDNTEIFRRINDIIQKIDNGEYEWELDKNNPKEVTHISGSYF
jgi:hypothetical protein